METSSRPAECTLSRMRLDMRKTRRQIWLLCAVPLNFRRHLQQGMRPPPASLPESWPKAPNAPFQPARRVHLGRRECIAPGFRQNQRPCMEFAMRLPRPYQVAMLMVDQPVQLSAVHGQVGGQRYCLQAGHFGAVRASSDLHPGNVATRRAFNNYVSQRSWSRRNHCCSRADRQRGER